MYNKVDILVVIIESLSYFLHRYIGISNMPTLTVIEFNED